MPTTGVCGLHLFSSMLAYCFGSCGSGLLSFGDQMLGLWIWCFGALGVEVLGLKWWGVYHIGAVS